MALGATKIKNNTCYCSPKGKKKSLSPFLLAELIDNSNGVCPLKNAKINELSDVRAQILYEKDFYKSHPVLNCTVHSGEEFCQI